MGRMGCRLSVTEVRIEASSFSWHLGQIGHLQGTGKSRNKKGNERNEVTQSDKVACT